MITVKEIIEKFNIPVKLNNTLMNFDIGVEAIGDNINELKEYHTETHDGQEIHVIEGKPEDRNNYEIVLNPENESVEWFSPPQDESDGTFPLAYIKVDKDGNVTEYN